MRVKRQTASEQDLAAVVVDHLHDVHAEVWQEVDVPGGVADIVARIGAEYWIVEVKACLSLALLCQAMDRRRLAHRVIVAAPYTKNLREVRMLCSEIGVGLWTVHLAGQWDPARCEQEVASKRWNTRPVMLAKRLSDGHKTHAKAGAVGGGGRWTPFRQTCEALLEVVIREPGITIRDAVASTKHHYRTASTARSSLATWIRDGKVPGVQFRDGALYPTEAP